MDEILETMGRDIQRGCGIKTFFIVRPRSAALRSQHFVDLIFDR